MSKCLFRVILLLLVVVALVACAGQNTHQTPVAMSVIGVESTELILAKPTTTFTDLVPPTVIPAIAASPTATLEPTEAVPTPTPEPANVPIEPLATAAAIRVDSWSLDGDWLAYWLSTEKDVTGYPFPSGNLNFLNIRTGQACSYPEYIARDYDDRVTWQSDGQVTIFSGDSTIRGIPCQNNFISIADYPHTDTDEANSALSPEGGYQVSTSSHREADGTINAVTTIINASTGEVKNIIEWKHRGGLGELGLGGQWLTEDLFLIHETLDQGPLLVTVGNGSIQVAMEMFGVTPMLDLEQENFVSVRAEGATVEGSDIYHIALAGVGIEAEFPPIMLYHSESGEAEEVPFKHLWFPAFSPDGQWLLLDERPTRYGRESYALWIRSVDPPGSQVRLLAKGTLNVLWSPDWKKAASGLPGVISIFAFPSGVQLGSWMIGEYEARPIAWSPDGESLSVQGFIPGQWKQALFVVRP